MFFYSGIVVCSLAPWMKGYAVVFVIYLHFAVGKHYLDFLADVLVRDTVIMFVLA